MLDACRFWFQCSINFYLPNQIHTQLYKRTYCVLDGVMYIQYSFVFAAKVCQMTNPSMQLLFDHCPYKPWPP